MTTPEEALARYQAAIDAERGEIDRYVTPYLEGPRPMFHAKEPLTHEAIVSLQRQHVFLEEAYAAWQVAWTQVGPG